MDEPKSAVVVYDPGTKAWYAASMQNTDGVFIDPIRVTPAVALLLDDLAPGLNRITLKTFQALRNEASPKGERPKKRRA